MSYKNLDWQAIDGQAQMNRNDGFWPEELRYVNWPTVERWLSLPIRQQETTLRGLAIQAHLQFLAELTGASLDTCRKYYMQDVIAARGEFEGAALMTVDTVAWAEFVNEYLCEGGFNDVVYSDHWKQRCYDDAVKSLRKYF